MTSSQQLLPARLMQFYACKLSSMPLQNSTVFGGMVSTCSPHLLVEVDCRVPDHRVPDHHVSELSGTIQGEFPCGARSHTRMCFRQLNATQ